MIDTAWLIVGILGFALGWVLVDFFNRGKALGISEATNEALYEALQKQQKVIDAQDRMLDAAFSAVPDRDALVERLRNGTF